jgi:hypothetical protein
MSSISAGDPIAAARTLARRGRHADALAILEPLFDDERLGNDSIDAALMSVWDVYGIPGALGYWATRLGNRLPVTRGARPASPRRRILPRSGGRVRVAIVSFNWNFLDYEVEALSGDPRFELRLVWPGAYVRGPSAGGGRRPRLTQADPRHARVLRWADVVLCEWCDRPAVWLASCLPSRTALCIRFHSYEAHSPYPMLVDWRRVSDLIFVSDHIREYVDARLSLTRQVRTSVVPLVHRVADFVDEKRPNARWTLGMIGYNSRNKHPIMALEILARLRQHDRRWRLRLVGHGFRRAPGGDSDRAYGSSFWRAVDALGLTAAVTVSPFTDDLRDWLTGVGFILSTSEREGTHEAVAQGMSSGAIPVVRRWPVFRSLSAAERQYPTAIHFDTPEEAVSGMLSFVKRARTAAAFRACALEYAAEARRRFDLSVGIPSFLSALRRAAGYQE